MNCKEILAALAEMFPPESAEEWDNPGLLAGKRDQEVSLVMTALDANDEVIDQAVSAGADLLVTHHPLIFGSIRSVSTDTFIGARLVRLIENGISCYAMHTNYDVCAMGELNAQQLGLADPQILSFTGEDEGLGCVGELKEPMDYYDFAAFVKKALDLSDVRCYGAGGFPVRRVAVCGGSGKSLIADALASGADVFVTGDIDYHTGTDAWAQGLRIIDAGHYGTEHGFAADVKKRLKERFPELNVLEASPSVPYKLI